MSRHKSREPRYPADLPEDIASKALNSGRHREAIEAYKALLKNEQRTEWVEALAAAYHGRACDLQAKGMLVEAITIWRNRAKVCVKPLAEVAYIDCLCQTGDYETALRLIGELADPEQRSTFETRLAAKVLLAPPSVLTVLPESSALRRHHASAVAALAACSQGDTTALDEALRNIPFRSPYRDLRPILKALDQIQHDPAQSKELLTRVSAETPFAKLANVARLALLPDNEWLPALSGLDKAEQQFLFALKGCPEKIHPLLLELSQLGATPAPSKVVPLLMNYATQCPRAAELCVRLLPQTNLRSKEFAQYLRKLSPFEAERVQALFYERTRDSLVDIKTHWLNAVSESLKSGKDSRLAAMILYQLANSSSINPRAKKTELSEDQIEWLEESLRLDPDNQPGHLQLIRAHKAAKRLKEARQCLEVVLARAPNDPETLLVAVEIALAGESFKKATTFAKQLLKLDPINPKVRTLIADALLAQARKQIRAGRIDLAEKELDLAEPWFDKGSDQPNICLLRWLVQPKANTAVLSTELIARIGGPLTCAFHLSLEVQRLKLPVGKLFERAGLAVLLKKQPTEHDVVCFIAALDAVTDPECTVATVLFMPSLHQSLEKTIDSPLTNAQRIALCEVLLRKKAYSLLFTHAEAATKRHKQTPLLLFFSCVGLCKGNVHQLSDRYYHALERASSLAKSEGDERTASRIVSFITPEAEWFEDDSDDSPNLFQGKAQERVMIDMILQMAGKKKFFEFVREIVGAPLFDSMRAMAGKNDQKLIDLLISYIQENGLFESLISGSSPASTTKPKPKKPASAAASDVQKDLFDD